MCGTGHLALLMVPVLRMAQCSLSLEPGKSNVPGDSQGSPMVCGMYISCFPGGQKMTI